MDTNEQWQRRTEIVERLPHGSGWNDSWHIELSPNQHFTLGMSHTVDNGYGQYTFYWEYKAKYENGKYTLLENGYCGDADAWVAMGCSEQELDDLPPFEMLVEDLAWEIEEALNAVHN